MTATFRKKPIQVQAVQWTGHNLAELIEFTDNQFDAATADDRFVPAAEPVITGRVYDRLHSTWVGVKTGDWIIRGVAGEFYPCDQTVFGDTYEQVTG